MSSDTESHSREEIVTNILLRLSVKSLLRFKCVCKSWHDLIKSSRFIRKHLDSENNRPRLTVTKFGVDYNVEPLPLRAFDFYLLPEKIIAGVVPKHQRIYRCEDVTDFRGIYGPIDGLFVLEKGHYTEKVRFAWWNPATKTCRLIPNAQFDLQLYEDRTRTLAVGLDIVNHDYKIVWLRTFYEDEAYDAKDVPKVFGAVYSLKNDSWKFIDPDYPYNSQLCYSLNCTCLNGLYYWMCLSTENVYNIRTFHFTTELFGEMDAPPIPGDHWGTLMLRGGSLAAISCNDVAQPMTSCYGIWVRIRENNWIKVFTFNPPIPSHWPRGIWDYDKFVYELTETNRMVIYDHTAKEVTNLGFDHFQILSSGFCWSTGYKESIVPIKRENPTEQDNADYFLTKI